MLKLIVICPEDADVIRKIIEAASEAGAGVMGDYTQCAFVTKGTGQWFSGAGSHPAVGKVGELSRIPEVRIEMQCPDEKAEVVQKAVTMAHPYEKPAIEFYKLVNL